MKYFKAPLNWTPLELNPFSEDGLYGPEWICFHIDEVNKNNNFCGSGKNGLYVFSIGVDSSNLDYRLSDFLDYETGKKRNIIIWCSERLDIDSMLERVKLVTKEKTFIRPTDSRWVVHSTTLTAWSDIHREGMLKSLTLLHKEGKQIGGLGVKELGDPPEYADYIAFGPFDSFGPELVVASHGKGRIISDPNQQYEPGVRLYFDNHKIIRDGFIVRDGLHAAKVETSIALKPYLVDYISPADLMQSTWSPMSFYKKANDLFLKRRD